MTEQVFVSRERELGELQIFLDRALDGQGQICFVTGEAGDGKSTLVTEFARRQGCEVVGTAGDGEPVPPVAETGQG